MKKLTIVLLLVVAGCRRTVVVSGPAGTVTAGAPGAASPREALQRFMAAAKNQDLQEMGLIWGTSGGPALKNKEKREEKETREQREIILMCYLKHDSFKVLGEAPARDAERVLAVEVKFRDLTRPTNFSVTRGPNDRWYIRHFDIEALRDICARRA